MPTLGCLTLVAILGLLVAMPLLLAESLLAALQRLALSPAAALWTVFAIFAGSAINLPVRRFEREELQPVAPLSILGFYGPRAILRRVRSETVIAVNVGGCLIPAALALWEGGRILALGGWPVAAMGLASSVNVVACYLASRPIEGVGIAMPAFVSPLVAVSATWLLLGGTAGEPVRVAVAFVAGIAGPLIGADLLHLKDLGRISTGIMSIGGAGTFDGIVLSGLLAVLLA